MKKELMYGSLWFMSLVVVFLLGSMQPVESKISTNAIETCVTYCALNAQAESMAGCFAEETYPGQYVTYLQTNYAASDVNCNSTTWNYVECDNANRQGKFMDYEIKQHPKRIWAACKLNSALDVTRAATNTAIEWGD